ncbi:hypothetical protein KIN20_010574 [Parelaphostrongylus tenuis]|uniref:Uncharacterized protein n=1 Tax=Parelaphostrongylus tenuis TaxID=148309 RepID=A0AAD5QKB2_PARTN|nr:hypothetical protein KIN20_010574 [Parelaphostrongylus tenuis]
MSSDSCFKRNRLLLLSSVRQSRLCAANSVSHVKVTSLRKQENNFYVPVSVYGLDHIEVYKVIKLKATEVTYMPMLVAQVNDRYLTGAVEWSTVSQELRENLKKIQC